MKPCRIVLSVVLLVVISAPSFAQEDAALVRLAKQVEPGLGGVADRLPQYIEFYRSKLGNDPNLFLFKVRAEVSDNGPVRLTGFVEFPEARNGLEKYLKALSFSPIENQIETLPAPSLGDKAYGLVKSSHTLSYDRPQEPHGVVTDNLLGDPLYLLREEGDFLLAHSSEGYLGYVASKDVIRLDSSEFTKYLDEPRMRIVDDCTLDSGLVLPVGASLKRDASEDGPVRCVLPDGKIVEVPADKCLPDVVPSETIARAISSGREFMGTPYYWGGKNTAGVDCSGLVQVSFATVGMNIPRDAYQQVFLGQLTATRWHRSRLRPGDTLYFIGNFGKIRHTAIYLGDDRFLHAEEPVVHISSFNPEDEDYSAKRDAQFAFAKRLW